LFVPQTGIVDYTDVVDKYSELIINKGGVIRINSKVNAVRIINSEIILLTPGNEYKARLIVNCAGLQSDRVAKCAALILNLKLFPSAVNTIS
jgi:(S)-2-hydroxyglutarate dehydrogenase